VANGAAEMSTKQQNALPPPTTQIPAPSPATHNHSLVKYYQIAAIDLTAGGAT